MKKITTTTFLILIYFSFISHGTFAKTIEEQKAECTGLGYEWDTGVNACKQTQAAVEMKEDHDECAESEDPEACYMKTAEESTGVKKGEGTDQKGGGLLKTAAGAYSLYMTMGGLVSGGGFSFGPCMSKMVFGGTTGAWTLGDMFLKKSAKESFEKLAKQYDDEAKNQDQKGSESGSYQAQVRSFVYLKQEQELVKQQADKRVKLQMLVTAGYGVSLGLAIIESIPGWGMLTACKGEGAAAEAGGGATDAATPTSGGAAPSGGALASIGGQVLKLGTSPQIAVVSGIMTAASMTLVKKAKEQKADAEANIKMIDGMLDTFAQQMAGYCPDGREDLGNARCYCYGSDGQKNDDRTNSAMCKNLWDADDNNFTLAETNYNLGTSGSAQVCMTITGTIDANCKCLKMIDPNTKQNACHKSPTSIAGAQNFAGSVAAAGTLKSINSFNTGANNALASLNGEAAQKAATRTNAVVSQLISQANKKGAGVPTQEQFEQRANELSLKAATPKAMAAFNGSSAGGRAFAGLRPQAVQKVVDKEEEVTVAEPTKITTGSANVAAIVSAKKKFKFNWNDSASSGQGTQVKNFAETQKPTYSIKDSDITQKRDKNLFHIISKRYQGSGLRRLFSDE